MTGAVLNQTRFGKRRKLATAIATTGIPVGNLLAPLLLSQVLQLFGWRSSLLLHGGVIMQMIWLSWAWPSKLKSKSVPKRNSSSRCCFELSLLCDAALVVFVVCLSLQHVAAYASVDHTPSRVVHLGGSVEEAASLVTIICVGPFNLKSSTQPVSDVILPLQEVSWRAVLPLSTSLA